MKLCLGTTQLADTLKAGKDLMRFQRNHAAERDILIAHLLKRPDSLRIRLSAPPLGDADRLKRQAVSLVKSQELTCKLDRHVETSFPFVEFIVGDLGVAIRVAKNHVVKGQTVIELAIQIELDDVRNSERRFTFVYVCKGTAISHCFNPFCKRGPVETKKFAYAEAL